MNIATWEYSQHTQTPLSIVSLSDSSQQLIPVQDSKESIKFMIIFESEYKDTITVLYAQMHPQIEIH